MRLNSEQPLIVKLQTTLLRSLRHVLLSLGNRLPLFYWNPLTHSLVIFMVKLVFKIWQIFENLAVYSVDCWDRGHEEVRTTVAICFENDMVWRVHAFRRHSMSGRRYFMNLLLLLRHQFEVTLMCAYCLIKIMSLLRGEWKHVVLCLFNLVLKAFVFLT